MSFRGWQRVLVVGSLSIFAIMLGFTSISRAQQESTRDESGRKVQTKVAPVYPDLARRMKISGAVKVEVTVAANGAVKDTKIVGGHPLLANAVVDAVRKWRYEARAQASTETLEFRFDPSQ